jgi:hypothetical protein
MGKKFKDTKVGQWLSNKAPDVVDAVGDVFPPAKLLGKLIWDRDDLSEADKATFQQHLKEYEAELDYHLKNTGSARSIYKLSKDVTDDLANRIMTWNLPIIVLLVFVNIFCVKFLDSALLAIVSNVIGRVMQKLFEERSTVTNFYLGSSKGSKDKDNSFIKNQSNGKIN